ncbi:hypothetical protein SBA4_1900025 [Candidatus Sulfopaludibacter sp. SbA4]|nr:hypothetical protein SBA4_1900025 [Candidatus Sulfopaludibacter sp. SbA4]
MREVGIEPTTARLSVACSTGRAALAKNLGLAAGFEPASTSIPRRGFATLSYASETGAGKGT